jgi:hypothetical protein
MCLQFGFVILWQKAFGAKAALKTLVKLTPGGRNWQLIDPYCLYWIGPEYLYQLTLMVQSPYYMHEPLEGSTEKVNRSDNIRRN